VTRQAGHSEPARQGKGKDTRRGVQSKTKRFASPQRVRELKRPQQVAFPGEAPDIQYRAAVSADHVRIYFQ
jgi:hypothetical protein